MSFFPDGLDSSIRRYFAKEKNASIIVKIKRRASDSVSMSKTIERITLNFKNHSIFKIRRRASDSVSMSKTIKQITLNFKNHSIFKIRRRASKSVSMSKTIEGITLNLKKNHSILKIRRRASDSVSMSTNYTTNHSQHNDTRGDLISLQ